MSSVRPPSTPITDATPRRKWRIAKLLGSLAFYGASQARRALRKLIGLNCEDTIVIINYHQVPAAERERFARQMDHLVRWTEPVDTTFSMPWGAYASRRYVMVTADDAWKSFNENALPELVRRNIPLTVFAISNKLGESIDGISGDRIVSEAELQELAMSATIGSHTASHVAMTSVSPARAVDELSESRERLTAITGRVPRLFCFPYGAFNNEVVVLARRAGYERVFTVLPEFAHPNQFVTGRIRVDPSDWPLEFHLKIMGAYAWTSRVMKLKRRLIRAVGR